MPARCGETAALASGGRPILGRSGTEHLLREPSRIVIGMQERPVSVLLDLRYSGHLIKERLPPTSASAGRVCTKELRPSQLIYFGEFVPRRRMLIYQNIASTTFAAIGIVLPSPLVLLTARAVRSSSSGR